MFEITPENKKRLRKEGEGAGSGGKYDKELPGCFDNITFVIIGDCDVYCNDEL